MKRKALYAWIPFVLVSVCLISMGIGIGLCNRAWQAEAGLTPMNNDWPMTVQWIGYWLTMVGGWVLPLPILWVIIGPQTIG